MADAAIDFKNPDWYDEEDINIFREAVHGFYAREMAPHSEGIAPFPKNMAEAAEIIATK